MTRPPIFLTSRTPFSPSLLASVRDTQPDARNVLVLSRHDGVDGGTAQAAPERPLLPMSPPDRPKTSPPDRQSAARAVDGIRGD
jgi:hypothetical protein